MLECSSSGIRCVCHGNSRRSAVCQITCLASRRTVLASGVPLCLQDCHAIRSLEEMRLVDLASLQQLEVRVQVWARLIEVWTCLRATIRGGIYGCTSVSYRVHFSTGCVDGHELGSFASIKLEQA